MYLIDIRERELIRILGAASVKQLPIADIWIGVSDELPVSGGLLIERKSIRDLEASIMDGRYREQRHRLLAYCQETHTLPLYILEGSYFTSTGRIGPHALMKFVARLQYKYRVPVIHTQNTAETSQVVEALHAYFLDDPTNFQFSSEQIQAIDGIHVQKKANALQPRHFATAALAQCPGVSVKMADAILKQLGSWDAILAATSDTIQGIVQENGRKVGPAVAKRLYEILHTSWG